MKKLRENGNREEKMQYGLKNTKYMTVITGRKEQEQIEEEVKEGKNTKIKPVIKENITTLSSNTFNWIANGDKYMASKERIEYSILMLIHSIIKNNKERIL